MANQALETLQQEVAENATVIDSAIALIEGISAKLKEALASQDWEAVSALSSELDAKSNALAEAITANTPTEEA